MEIKKVKVKENPNKNKKSFLGKIKNWNWKKVVTWSPRVLAILYTIFITIFAFDESVFTLPWFVHIMPTIILSLIIIFTWKKPLSAAITFFILGFGFTLIFKTYTNWLVFLIISLPLILMGTLFLLEKLFIKKRDEHHQKIRKDRKNKLLMKK